MSGEPITRQCAGHEVVALIAAAGRGRRLRAMPGSKEVFPLAFTETASGELRVKVASQFLFEQLASVGIGKGIIVLREGKWDIPAFYGEGEPANMKLSYVVVGPTIGPPDSLDRAYPFVRSDVVAFGFPDILMEPADIFEPLLKRLDRGDMDVVMAVYETKHEHHTNCDYVQMDESGRVLGMSLKDPNCGFAHHWICAVWTPTFTEYMHDFVAKARETHSTDDHSQIDASGDLPVGRVLQAAVEDGLNVAAVAFAGRDQWVDVGSPDDLVRTAARLRQYLNDR
jgi:glucose-1-phosphate thymidylyltransferase